MCNLYRLDKGQDTLRRYFKVGRADSGNQPPLPGIYPDNVAPIIRQEGSERVMQMARWGQADVAALSQARRDRSRGDERQGNEIAALVRWLKPEHRCLVPVTAFSEPQTRQTRRRAGTDGPGSRWPRICCCSPSPAPGAAGTARAAPRRTPSRVGTPSMCS
jgi:putative SOS response-associated peptidase YedK